MADSDVILRIKVLADATAAAAGLKGAQRETSKFERGVGRMTAPAAAAGLAIVALGKVSLDAASDMQQAQGAVEAVFGKQAGAVEELSKRSATAMGLSGAEYMNYAALVGTAMQNAGMSVKDSVAASDKVMQRGADLSALYGGTTAEAVEAINAAVARSEFDPLEKYGASLNMTAVNAELAARGQDKLTGAALDTAKKQIILEQVFKKTSKAAGQYAREADSVAGQTQTATAQWKDAAAALGTALLPVAAEVIGHLADMATWAQQNSELVQHLAVGVLAVSAAIISLNVALKVARTVQGAYNLALLVGTKYALGTRIQLIALAVAEKARAAATWLSVAAQKALNVAMRANVIGLIVTGLLAIAAAFVWAYRNSETFRRIVDATWRAVKAGATAAWQWVKGAWDKIVGAGKAAFNWIKSNWGLLLAGVLAGPFGIAVALIVKHWDKIKAAARNALDTIRGVVVSIGQGIVNAWYAVMDRMVGAVLSLVSREVRAFNRVVDAITGVFKGAGRWLYSVGVDIVRGLVDGIESVIGWVRDKVEALADAVPGWVKKRLGISSPSKVMKAIGAEVSRGLAIGMEDAASKVQQSAEAVAGLIANAISAKIKNDRAAAQSTRKVLRSIADENAALLANARARDAMAVSVEEARKALADATQTMDDYAASVRNAATAWAGVGSLSDLGEGVAMDARNLADAMAARVAAVEEFSSLLVQLKASGLAQSVIDALAQAGVEGGLAQARAIARGGPAAVTEFNTLQTRLETAAGTLGANTSTWMYAAGVKSAQAFLNGLLLDQQALDTAAQRLASALEKAISKALNKALKGKGGKASGSTARVATPALFAAGASTAPGMSGYGATRSTSTASVVNINVTGAIDPERTARQIKRILSGHDRRVGGLVTA